MAKNIYDGKYAENTMDSLLSGSENARAISIGVAANTEEIKRGTIMKLNGSTYEAAASADIVAGCNVVVLDEDVAISEKATAARAYQSGIFMPDKLILSDGGTLDAAKVAVLRNAGILLKAYEKADSQPSAVIE